ncbi:hypothetical protein OQA88_7556 [Cercophora sp. LCS_1]
MSILFTHALVAFLSFLTPVAAIILPPVSSLDAHLLAPKAATTCIVNSRNSDDWIESGLHIWRTVFSSDGIEPQTYCDFFWTSCSWASNIQCFWGPDIEGGTWVVDASFPLGPHGDNEYRKCLTKTRELWMDKYHCTTGGPKVLSELSQRDVDSSGDDSVNPADSAHDTDASVPSTAPTGAALGNPQGKNCSVSAWLSGEWVEYGLTRWRVSFETENLPTATYCFFWLDCHFISNIQCYYHKDLKTWVIDTSFPRGPAGDSEFYHCLDRTRQQWAGNYNCGYKRHSHNPTSKATDNQLEAPADVIARSNAPTGKPCTVNAHEHTPWVEAGLTRWRTTFNAVGIEPESYRAEWNQIAWCMFASNIQVWYSPDIDNGTWILDASFPRGPGGDDEYHRCLSGTLYKWAADNVCDISDDIPPAGSQDLNLPLDPNVSSEDNTGDIANLSGHTARAAPASPAETEKKCIVNSREYDEWWEDGWQRRRTVFSAEGIDPQTYCQFWGWDCCAVLINVQCFYSPDIENGTWVVDANFVLGVAGDQQYYNCLTETRNRWLYAYGCGTGALGDPSAMEDPSAPEDGGQSNSAPEGVPALANVIARDDTPKCYAWARQYGEWVEHGMTRWRTIFGAQGLDDAQIWSFCDYWNFAACPILNVQCWYSPDIEGGTHVVDVSTARGPVGDKSYWDCFFQAEMEWIWGFHCNNGTPPTEEATGTGATYPPGWTLLPDSADKAVKETVDIPNPSTATDISEVPESSGFPDPDKSVELAATLVKDAWPAASSTAPRNCHLIAWQFDEWVEMGLTRWRTLFRMSGTYVTPWVFRDRWTQCGFIAIGNIGTWYANSVSNGKTTVNHVWVMDTSFPRGPAGDMSYWFCLHRVIEFMVQTFGCEGTPDPDDPDWNDMAIA